jgi:AcrR family transcriptional regulator
MSRIPDPNIRIALLRSARHVFADRGMARAKVEEITRGAGCSKGAFYLHFASKEDCFKMLVEAFMAECQERFASPPGGSLGPQGAEQLIANLFELEHEQFDLLWQNRVIVGMLQGTCKGDLAYLLQAFRETVHSRAQEWAEYFKLQGFYRDDVDVHLAAMIMSGAYNELAIRFAASATKPPIALWLRATQSAFARAFGTPEFIQTVSRVHEAIRVLGGAAALRSGSDLALTPGKAMFPIRPLAPTVAPPLSKTRISRAAIAATKQPSPPSRAQTAAKSRSKRTP